MRTEKCRTCGETYEVEPTGEVQRRFRGGREEKEMTESNTRRSKTTAPGERHSRGGLLTAIPRPPHFNPGPDDGESGRRAVVESIRLSGIPLIPTLRPIRNLNDLPNNPLRNPNRLPH
jgi:hypothetical protein